jgi:hypothetical protein
MLCNNCRIEINKSETKYKTEMCNTCSEAYFVALNNKDLSGNKKKSNYLALFTFMFTKNNEHYL